MSVTITSAKLTGTTVRAEANSAGEAPTWNLKILTIPGPSPQYTNVSPSDSGGSGGHYFAIWNNVTAPPASCTVVANIGSSKIDFSRVVVGP